MTDARTITTRQWQQLHAEALYERAVAQRRLTDGQPDTQDYWMGYEAACSTLLNAIRRIDRGEPPRPIEDILTE